MKVKQKNIAFVFDACVLRNKSDRVFLPPEWEKLLHDLSEEKYNVKPFIPQIVCEELSKNKKQKASLEKLLKDFNFKVISSNDSQKRFKEIKSRAIERKAPFKHKRNTYDDSGFRDSVWWLDVIDYFQRLKTDWKVYVCTTDGYFHQKEKELAKEFPKKNQVEIIHQNEINFQFRKKYGLVKISNSEYHAINKIIKQEQSKILNHFADTNSIPVFSQTRSSRNLDYKSPDIRHPFGIYSK